MQIQQNLMDTKSTKSLLKWHAKWIWLDYITPYAINSNFKSSRILGVLPSEKNRWGIFRKTFTLPEDYHLSKPGKIYISVDSRYKLFLNGTYIGRGIYRCNKYNWYYDEYDISAYLQSGKNVIAIIATFYGEDMSWYEPLPQGIMGPKTVGKGGMIFQLELPLESGMLIICSDQSTRGMLCDAWDQSAPRINVGLPFMEKFDAHKWDSAWITTDFSEDRTSAWSQVIELVLGNNNIPLVKTDIPRIAESSLQAKALITAGTWESIFDDEDLAQPETLDQDKIDGFNQLVLSPLNNQYKSIVGSWTESQHELHFDLGKGSIGLVFDMGKTVSGFPFFTLICDSDDVVVDLAWAEKIVSKEGVFVPNLNGWKVKQGLQYRCRKGFNHFESFHWFGYRYLQMNISGSDSSIILKNLGTILYQYPIKSIGQFECNNPEWNQLFEVCSWTMRTCMHDGYEDCPSREQRQWVGDAYIESMVAFALFGETKLTRKLLTQTAQSQRGDGLTQMVTPGDSSIHGLLIPDFCLYYISTVYQYYHYVGDISVIIEHLPVILRSIRWFLQYIHPITGLVTNLPHWIFIDWSLNDKWGANGVVNAQLYHALSQIQEMVAIAGWGNASAGLPEIAKKIKQGLDHYLWNPSRNAYIDSVDFDEKGQITRFSDKVSFHTNSLMLLYDFVPNEKIPLVLEAVFNVPDSKLYVQNRVPLWHKKTSSNYRYETDVILAEPFFMHHVNQMFAKFDRFDLLARFLNDGWCEMLRQGATSIWETWGNQGSLCHAWSCTPSYDLLTHCLGVQILDPGANSICISPHPMGLTWAKGIVPTIKGAIHIEWSVDPVSGKINLTYQAPDGIKVIVMNSKL